MSLVCYESQVDAAQAQLQRLLGHKAQAIYSLKMDGTGPQCLLWRGELLSSLGVDKESVGVLLRNNIELLHLAVAEEGWSSVWPVYSYYSR